MKSKLLKNCKEILHRPNVKIWYEKYLVNEPQEYTLQNLSFAVIQKDLTLEEVLALALITGYQNKMIFKIHGTSSDGTEDYIVLNGDTHKEIQLKADKETIKRGWKNCWSERIE